MTYKEVVQYLNMNAPRGRGNGKAVHAMVVNACKKQIDKKLLLYQDHTVHCGTCFHEIKNLNAFYCEICGQKVAQK